MSKLLVLLLICAGLTTGAYFYQYVTDQNYKTAFERAFFMCLGALAFAATSFLPERERHDLTPPPARPTRTRFE